MLALDVGDATIGMAVSDELGIAATGLPTWRRTNLAADLEALRKVLHETGAERIAIGVPYNMDGTLSEQTKKTLAFKDHLAVLALPVDEVDERWTTMAADRAMLEGDLSRKKRKKLKDKLSAVLILQTYMQMQGNRP